MTYRIELDLREDLVHEPDAEKGDAPLHQGELENSDESVSIFIG